MQFRDFFPIRQAPVKGSKKQATILPDTDQKGLSRLYRVAALALGYQTFSDRVSNNGTFEAPPFDFDRIIQAIDTDSYARQAFNKYKELFWKEGWEIVSENPEARAYLMQRIDFMEVAMKRSFQDFLVEIADQLVRLANVFIVKSRGDLTPFFPGKLYPPEGKNPIVGYYTIPTERTELLRTKNNKVVWYRQQTDATGFGGDNQTMPRWRADDVIHLAIDKKPGRAFGTPFVASALDDIIALRQIEEDIQNLVHRELFPLYKFKVGTDEFPATDEELEKAASEIEGLRTEGALILSHRHDVEVIGAGGNTLDAGAYLNHFKERVAIGLGVYPHHLGMGSNASQGVTDRLDAALYDKVKEYQRRFEDYMRLFIFNDLLVEGGFDPYTNPESGQGTDRCYFKFNEIDVDTEVKKGAYVISKVAAMLETIPEGRRELKLPPEMEAKDTTTALQVALQPPPALGAGSQPAKSTATNPGAAQKPSTGGKPNLPNKRKGASNMIRPTNQYGTRTSPNVRRNMSDDLINEIVSLIDDTIVEE